MRNLFFNPAFPSEKVVNSSHGYSRQQLLSTLEDNLGSVCDPDILKPLVQTLQDIVQSSIRDKQRTVERLDECLTVRSQTQNLLQGLIDKLNQQLSPYASQDNLTVYECCLKFLGLLARKAEKGVFELSGMPIASSFGSTDPLELLAAYPATIISIMSLSQAEMMATNNQIEERLNNAYHEDKLKYHLMMALFGCTESLKEQFAYLLKDSPLLAWQSELNALHRKRNMIEDKLAKLKSGSPTSLSLNKEYELLEEKRRETLAKMENYHTESAPRNLIYLTQLSILLSFISAETISENVNNYLQQENLFAPLHDAFKNTSYESLSKIISWLREPIQTLIVQSTKHVDYESIASNLREIQTAIGNASNERAAIMNKSASKIGLIITSAVAQALASEHKAFLSQLSKHSTPEENSQIVDFNLTFRKVFSSMLKASETNEVSTDYTEGKVPHSARDDLKEMIDHDNRVLESLVQLDQLLHSPDNAPTEATSIEATLTGATSIEAAFSDVAIDAIRKCGTELIALAKSENQRDQQHQDDSGLEEQETIAEAEASTIELAYKPAVRQLMHQMREDDLALNLLICLQPMMNAQIDSIAEHASQAQLSVEKDTKSDNDESIRPLILFSDSNKERAGKDSRETLAVSSHGDDEEQANANNQKLN